MKIIGTVNNTDGSQERISFEGSTYEDARARLDALLTDAQQLIVIRADR